MITKERALSFNPEMVFCDGFDAAFVGVVEIPNGETVACYSVEKMVQVLKGDGTEEQAREYLEYNVLSTYLGPHTPVYLHD